MKFAIATTHIASKSPEKSSSFMVKALFDTAKQAYEASPFSDTAIIVVEDDIKISEIIASSGERFTGQEIELRGYAAAL